MFFKIRLSQKLCTNIIISCENFNFSVLFADYIAFDSSSPDIGLPIGISGKRLKEKVSGTAASSIAGTAPNASPTNSQRKCEP